MCCRPDDLEDFETWLRSWGASEQTIKSRVTTLRAAVREWGDPREVGTAELEAWLGNPAWSPWTKVTYFSHMRSLFEWMAKARLRPDDPTTGMRAPKPPKGRPRPLTVAEEQRVLESARGDQRTWLMLGIYAGLRAHEVAKFRGEDIDADAIYVMGKGQKAAMLPTHEVLWELAQSYPRQGWWFPRPTTRGHISSTSITNSTTRLFKRLGIAGSHHRCRHTYGTNLLRAGANIRVVQTLLRHDSLASTQRYTAVDEDERRSAIASLLTRRAGAAA